MSLGVQVSQRVRHSQKPQRLDVRGRFKTQVVSQFTPGPSFTRGKIWKGREMKVCIILQALHQRLIKEYRSRIDDIELLWVTIFGRGIRWSRLTTGGCEQQRHEDGVYRTGKDEFIDFNTYHVSKSQASLLSECDARMGHRFAAVVSVRYSLAPLSVHARADFKSSSSIITLPSGIIRNAQKITRFGRQFWYPLWESEKGHLA